MKRWHAHSFRGLSQVSAWLNEEEQQHPVILEYFGQWADGEFIVIATTTEPLLHPPAPWTCAPLVGKQQ